MLKLGEDAEDDVGKFHCLNLGFVLKLKVVLEPMDTDLSSNTARELVGSRSVPGYLIDARLHV